MLNISYITLIMTNETLMKLLCFNVCMHAAQANEVHLVIVLDHYIVMHSDILHVHTW